MKRISEKLDQDLFLYTRGELGSCRTLRIRLAMMLLPELRLRAQRYDRVGEMLSGVVRGELSQPLVVNVGHAFTTVRPPMTKQRLLLLSLIILMMSMALAFLMNHTVEARAIVQGQSNAPLATESSCGPNESKIAP